MTSAYRVVLFDLGNTLIYSINPWEEILFQGIVEFHRIIEQTTPNFSKSISPQDLQICLFNYYDQRAITLEEKGSYFVLKNLLQANGFINISDSLIRFALDEMYNITQSNWRVEEKAIKTLSYLVSQGFKLGLLSNAADDKDVQQLIDLWQLRDFFDFILTSVDCGYRKPHPTMFQLALSHFSVTPQETIMIGDTLTADILGANELGIFSVWINHRSKTKSVPVENKPNAIITNLEALIPLIGKI